MARDPQKQGPYTLREALKEANSMLEDEFGKVDQSAAVSLASVLYTSHERDVFIKEHEGGPDTPYGGGHGR